MKKLMMLAFTLFTAANLFAYDVHTMTFDEKEEYCDEVVNWEYDDICTHEVYCESIYWEDEDNCTYFEPGNLKVDADFCKNIIWDSTKAACFKAIEDDKKTNTTKG